MSEIYIKNDVESLDLEEQGVNRTSNPINMCDINAINSDNNLEIENKIDVEEGILGLDCLKKELVDDDHDQPLQDTEMNENDYKINIQEVLMDTYDTEIKNEETVVKSENIKQECVFDIQVGLVAGSVDNIYCDLCGKDYAGYCSRCSSLSHCLSNNVSSTDPEWNTKTIPTNILEIKLVNDRSGVFAVRTIPKSVILGPFEGVLPIESTTGNMWKMKDKKLVNAENGNWMQHVCSTGNALFKNLDTFQFGGYLYYQTTREVNESDELLVCYREEEMQKSDNSEECYYIPIKLEQSQKVFACTLCCLGFRLEKCLTEHKSKCPHAEHNKAVEEIIECRTCNIWLEKQEYEEHHQVYCSEIYPRVNDHPAPYNEGAINEDTPIANRSDPTKVAEELKAIEISKNELISEERNIKKRLILNRRKNKNKPINRKTVEYTGESAKYHKSSQLNILPREPIVCDICMITFAHKSSLRTHIRNIHTKERIKESFYCDICMAKFAYQSSLKNHIKYQHTEDGIRKKYKCPHCSYRSNRQHLLKTHLRKHVSINQFQCGTCLKRFKCKDSLRQHIKVYHTKGNEKKHDCPHCSYRTHHKFDLKKHIKKHTKPFHCHICVTSFTNEQSLKRHIDWRHPENRIEKRHKCPKCSYQSNHRNTLKKHLFIHSLKSFECYICGNKYSRKDGVKRHIELMHQGIKKNFIVEKYECDICSAKFDQEKDLKSHVKSEHNHKSFECYICGNKYSKKHGLKRHIESIHQGIKKDFIIQKYECDICSAKFDQKENLKTHVRSEHF